MRLAHTVSHMVHSIYHKIFTHNNLHFTTAAAVDRVRYRCVGTFILFASLLSEAELRNQISKCLRTRLLEQLVRLITNLQTLEKKILKLNVIVFSTL